ncbi:hypothetical protein CSKR_111215, partial [Clonorchis sinensis]
GTIFEISQYIYRHNTLLISPRPASPFLALIRQAQFPSFRRTYVLLGTKLYKISEINSFASIINERFSWVSAECAAQRPPQMLEKNLSTTYGPTVVKTMVENLVLIADEMDRVDHKSCSQTPHDLTNSIPVRIVGDAAVMLLTQGILSKIYERVPLEPELPASHYYWWYFMRRHCILQTVNSEGFSPPGMRLSYQSNDSRSEMAQWSEREFTDRKVRGSNPTSAPRLPLSRLGQPDSIPALVLPSGGMTARHRKGATAERSFITIYLFK